MAITELGLGLCDAGFDEDALTVREADLSMMRRLGASESNILVAQSNLALTYAGLGRFEEAMGLRRDVYSGRLKLHGVEHERTLRAALNYASILVGVRRFPEAKKLMRKTMPVARRVLGERNILTLKMTLLYSRTLYLNDGATLDDLREAVTTLEETEPIARRVFGGAHPHTEGIANSLRAARAALTARETPWPPDTG
jgi:hypothetical protein